MATSSYQRMGSGSSRTTQQDGYQQVKKATTKPAKAPTPKPNLIGAPAGAVAAAQLAKTPGPASGAASVPNPNPIPTSDPRNIGGPSSNNPVTATAGNTGGVGTGNGGMPLPEWTDPMGGFASRYAPAGSWANYADPSIMFGDVLSSMGSGNPNQALANYGDYGGQMMDIALILANAMSGQGQ